MLLFSVIKCLKFYSIYMFILMVSRVFSHRNEIIYSLIKWSFIIWLPWYTLIHPPLRNTGLLSSANQTNNVGCQATSSSFPGRMGICFLKKSHTAYLYVFCFLCFFFSPFSFIPWTPSYKLHKSKNKGRDGCGADFYDV